MWLILSCFYSLSLSLSLSLFDVICFFNVKGQRFLLNSYNNVAYYKNDLWNLIKRTMQVIYLWRYLIISLKFEQCSNVVIIKYCMKNRLKIALYIYIYMYNLYFIIYISTVILGIGCYIKDRNLMSWISIPFFSSGKKNKTKKKTIGNKERKRKKIP